MVRKQYFIRNDQIRFLSKLPGNDAEHVRAAIDDYIEKKRRETINVSMSQSKFVLKGGEENGSTNNIPNPNSF